MQNNLSGEWEKGNYLFLGNGQMDQLSFSKGLSVSRGKADWPPLQTLCLKFYFDNFKVFVVEWIFSFVIVHCILL